MAYYVLTAYYPSRDTGAETDYAKMDPIRLGDPLFCDSCNRAISALCWLPPFRVELEVWNACFGDISFGTGEELLVSEKFKQAWEEWGLTGLTGFDPVIVSRVRRHKRFQATPPNYYRVAVKRDPVRIDQKVSGFVWDGKPQCEDCNLGKEILCFDKIALHRDDQPQHNLFIPRGMPCLYMADQRFADFCQKERIANAMLVPADEYQCDYR